MSLNCSNICLRLHQTYYQWTFPYICTSTTYRGSKPLLQPDFGCLRMALCRLDSRELGGCRFYRCYIDHLHTVRQAAPCTPYIRTLQVTKERFLLGQSIENACWMQMFILYISCLVCLFSWQVGGKLSSLTFGTICRSLHSLNLYLLLSLSVNASEAKPSGRQQVGLASLAFTLRFQKQKLELCSVQRTVPKVKELS